MAHIDKVLDLRKDCTFNARVVDASRDQDSNLWNVKTLQGHTAQAKYLLLASGLLHRTYTPDFPGFKSYKGEIYHSAAWPKDFEAKGKRIGIIGAGATAVQITQELGKQADELTVLLRRPSYCLPVRHSAFYLLVLFCTLRSHAIHPVSPISTMVDRPRRSACISQRHLVDKMTPPALYCRRPCARERMLTSRRWANGSGQSRKIGHGSRTSQHCSNLDATLLPDSPARGEIKACLMWTRRSARHGSRTFGPEVASTSS